MGFGIGMMMNSIRKQIDPGVLDIGNVIIKTDTIDKVITENGVNAGTKFKEFIVNGTGNVRVTYTIHAITYNQIGGLSGYCMKNDNWSESINDGKTFWIASPGFDNRIEQDYLLTYDFYGLVPGDKISLWGTSNSAWGNTGTIVNVDIKGNVFNPAFADFILV